MTELAFSGGKAKKFVEIKLSTKNLYSSQEMSPVKLKYFQFFHHTVEKIKAILIIDSNIKNYGNIEN